MDTPVTNEPITHRILRLRQVIERTGLCRSTIYELQSQGYYPAKLKLSERAVGWVEFEIDAWLKARADLRRERLPADTGDPWRVGRN